MNRSGWRFSFSTFGESHGVGIGCVIEGVPAGLDFDEAFLADELARRKPGQNRFATQRKEDDVPEILSGVFEGKTTGTPIAILIRNTNQHSKDYGNVKDLFRPGHADFTYFEKYGIRDYRGGGRSSARESAARVAAGAVAKMMLRELGVSVQSGVLEVDGIAGNKIDFDHARQSEIYALDASVEEQQKAAIDAVRNAHDSCGGAALIQATGIPAGWGEPMYAKLDAELARLMMGLNAVKAVEIGEGIHAAKLKGSENNDGMDAEGFLSNHAGGVLGGISTGEALEVKVHFKPTPSIFKPQSTRNIQGESVEFELKGRHDPCVAVRGSVVAEAQMALVLADMALLNLGSRMVHLKMIYHKE